MSNACGNAWSMHSRHLETLFALCRFPAAGRRARLEDLELSESTECPGLLVPERCWATSIGGSGYSCAPQVSSQGPWVEGTSVLGVRDHLANTWKSHVVLVGCSCMLVETQEQLSWPRRGILNLVSLERRVPKAELVVADAAVCSDPKRWQ